MLWLIRLAQLQNSPHGGDDARGIERGGEMERWEVGGGHGWRIIFRRDPREADG